MDLAYHGIVHLQENIIRARRSHPTLAAGLINPALDISGLVNNFYTSIVNYIEAVHKPIEERYLDKNEDDKLYFTDCQYWKGKLKS